MLSKTLNFVQLCEEQPQLKAFFDEKSGRFPFSNQQAVILLTETLIHLDLGYKIVLDKNQICPNYFNRRDYVLFIERLLKLTPHLSDDTRLTGLDTGTSQSCIYPLISTRYLSNLEKMFATDIVPEFIQKAEGNVRMNKLEEKITLLLVQKDQNAFSQVIKKTGDYIHFTMCNPPFYTSRAEMLMKRKQKRSHYKTETEGHDSELITAGGDYGFIVKLILDSESVKNEVLWFTSLIGNHSTLIKFSSFLKDKSSISFGVYRFQSGSHTTRWIIFWTHQSQLKPPIELFNYSNAKINPNKIRRNLRSELGDKELRSIIVKYLTSLPYIALHLNHKFRIELPGNVFSRNYRRTNKVSSDGSTYIFEIDLFERHIVWRTGYDFKIFESFVNVLNSL